MKQILLTLFIGILLISLVSAIDPVFQVNKEFDLKRACSDNGFFCGNDFTCNITLISPDGTLITNNTIMTDQISFRNITVTQVQNDELGIIKAIEGCNNVTLAGLDTFDIFITADGKPFQQFPIQFVVIILSLILVGVGLIQGRLRMFKHIGSMLMLIMGVITLFPGYSFINWTTLMGKGMGFGLIGLGMFFLIEDAFSRDEQDEHFEQKHKGGGEDDFEES